MTTIHPGELLTLEAYLRLDEPGRGPCELVHGHLVREPAPGPLHGWVQAELAWRLGNHVRDARLGELFVDVGVVLSADPPTVRQADLAFVARRRLPCGVDDRVLDTTPDLLVEIVAPSFRAREIHEKVMEYLSAGAPLIWVVDPIGSSVTVYRGPRDVRILRGDDELHGGDLLPDFCVPVSLLLPG